MRTGARRPNVPEDFFEGLEYPKNTKDRFSKADLIEALWHYIRSDEPTNVQKQVLRARVTRELMKKHGEKLVLESLGKK